MVYHALSTRSLINSESPTDHQLLMGMRLSVIEFAHA